MDLERRIESLEAKNRTLTRLLTLLGTGMLSLTLMGAMRQAPEKIEAREFVLIDDAGKARAALRVVERKFGTVIHRGPSFVLSDSAGRERVELSCIEGNNGTNSVELELRDKDGNLHVSASGMSEMNFQSSLTVQHRKGPSATVFALPKRAEVTLGVDKGLGSDRV